MGEPWARPSHFVAMLVTAVLTCLIKNPIYLPIALFIAGWLVAAHGWRVLARREWIAFFGVTALTVLAYAGLYRAREPPPGPAGGRAPVVFASWREAFEPGDVLGDPRVAGNPDPQSTAVRGGGRRAGASLRRWSQEASRAVVLLAAASAVTMLVFLNVNYEHNYYQLPFVFPLGLLAAGASGACTRPFVPAEGGVTGRSWWSASS